MDMGIGVVGEGNLCKRRFRWLFYIPEVTLGDNAEIEGVAALPPEKSARPNLEFKSMSVRHQAEDVYYPAKPDWKPISLTLYDLKKKTHPVFRWVKEFYEPDDNSTIYAPNENWFIKECWLRLYDGCGEVVEKWIWEDAWLQNANFQTLDMGDSGIVVCDITLRYARAYVDYTNY